ncbi:hypothetical protein Y032_1033g3451 [Ancylostoma ceylanicum]|uniref:Uncharacterized protein n=1 Tax=Ancylostoma ceylanicum TaxID=53326 RepID=A0A016W7J4_9BILA|nr:hypothetical protein Y032_1033g3451 [Ancylostoma ceylanicum]
MNNFATLVLLFTIVSTSLFNSRCTFFSLAWDVTPHFDKIEPLCHRLLFDFNHESNVAQKARDINGEDKSNDK